MKTGFCTSNGRKEVRFLVRDKILRVFYSKPYRSVVPLNDRDLELLIYYLSETYDRVVRIVNAVDWVIPQNRFYRASIIADYRFGVEYDDPNYADIVVFAPGWEYDAWCRLDHDICEKQGIEAYPLPVDWRKRAEDDRYLKRIKKEEKP